MDDKMVRKLTWVDWTYYAMVASLMGYTFYLIYRVANEGGTGKLQLLRVTSNVCKDAAAVIGKWGMRAETAYHRIIDVERMN